MKSRSSESDPCSQRTRSEAGLDLLGLSFQRLLSFLEQLIQLLNQLQEPLGVEFLFDLRAQLVHAAALFVCHAKWDGRQGRTVSGSEGAFRRFMSPRAEANLPEISVGNSPSQFPLCEAIFVEVSPCFVEAEEWLESCVLLSGMNEVGTTAAEAGANLRRSTRGNWCPFKVAMARMRRRAMSW
jgi:hypothetical protein